MKNLMRLSIIVFVLAFVLVLPVFANTIPAQQIQAVSESNAIDQVAEQLFTLIYNVTFLPFASGLVLLLTSLAKRVIPTSSSILTMFFTVAIWALWMVANELGYGGQFESIVAALTSIGGAILGIGLTPIAAGAMYDEAHKRDIAILGYSRGDHESVG